MEFPWNPHEVKPMLHYVEEGGEWVAYDTRMYLFWFWGLPVRFQDYLEIEGL